MHKVLTGIWLLWLLVVWPGGPGAAAARPSDTAVHDPHAAPGYDEAQGRMAPAPSRAAAGDHAAVGAWPAEVKRILDAGAGDAALPIWRVVLQHFDDHLLFLPITSLAQHAQVGAGEDTLWSSLRETWAALGQFVRASTAMDQLQHALAGYRERRDRHGEAHALYALGAVQYTWKWDPMMGDTQHLPEWDFRASQARATFEQALALWRALGDRYSEAATLDYLAIVQERQEQYPEARATFEQALALWRTLGDRHGEASTLYALGAIQHTLGGVRHELEGHAEARATLEQAVALWRTLGEPYGEARTLDALGRVQISLGHYPEAYATWEQAAALWRALGERSREATTLDSLAAWQRLLGQYPEARATLKQAAALWRTLGERSREAAALAALGGVYASFQQYSEMQEVYQHARTLYQELGRPRPEVDILVDLGAIQTAHGQYPEALATLREAVALWRTLGEPHGEARTLQALGRVYAGLQQYSQMREVYQHARTLYQADGDAMGLVWLARDQANLGQSLEALASLEQARLLAQAHANHADEGDVLQHVGRVLAQMGRYPEALTAFAQALTLYRTSGNCQEVMDPSVRGGAHALALLMLVFGKVEALTPIEQVLTLPCASEHRQEDWDQRRDAEISTLRGMGDVYEALGQAEPALAAVRQAFALYGTLREDAIKQWNIKDPLGRLGALHQRHQQSAEALAIYEQIIVRARQRPDRRAEAAAWLSLSTLYRELGQFTPALVTAQEAWELYKALEQRPEAAQALYAQGVAQRHLGKLDQALEMFRQALGDAQRTEVQTIWYQLGLVYQERQQLDEAHAALQRAVAVAREAGDRETAGRALAALGAAANSRAAYTEALTFLREASETGFTLGWSDHAAIASALEHLGDRMTALQHYETAVRRLDAHRRPMRGAAAFARLAAPSVGGLDTYRRRIRDAALRADALREPFPVYQRLVTLLLNLHAADPGPRYDGLAFQYAEQGKARALLDQLAESRAGVRKGVEPALLVEEHRLAGDLALARAQLAQALPDDQRTYWQTQLDELTNQFETLSQRLRTGTPLYAALHVI